MIRGFVAGVLWGGAVAAVGLAVLSQLGAPPGAPRVPVIVAAEAPLPAQANRVAEPTPLTSLPAGFPPPAPMASDPAAVVPVVPELAPRPAEPAAAPDAPPPVIAAPKPLAPDVIGLAEPPAAPAGQSTDRVSGPDAPAPSMAGVPAQVAPDAPARAADPDAGAATRAGPFPTPNDPQDALLQPPPELRADPAPARIALDPGPQPALPPQPYTALPLQDVVPAQPGSPPAPVPLPEVTLDQPAAPEKGDGGTPRLAPVRPIVVGDGSGTLAPNPRLEPAEGVTVGRLPRIGAPSLIEVTPAPEDEGKAPDAPPLKQFARPFDNPDNKPLFAVLLRDSGEANLDRAALARISFPVTFVLDPLLPGAAEAARVYRKAGQEVVMLASGIPAGATPGDIEQSFQSLAGVLPEAVAVMDQATGGFQANRPLAAQVIPILAAQGRGLVSFDVGLNAADQEARRAALPSVMIFRRLDADSESGTIVRRYLDRAAFRAAQEGKVVVLGETRPETVAALLEWAVEGRAASVAMAPVTAVLAVP